MGSQRLDASAYLSGGVIGLATARAYRVGEQGRALCYGFEVACGLVPLLL